MTIQISLTPEQEARLRDRAASVGQDMQAYAQDALVALIDRPTLAEILRPIHEDTLRRGITVEEIDNLLDDARKEVWAAGGPSPSDYR